MAKAISSSAPRERSIRRCHQCDCSTVSEPCTSLRVGSPARKPNLVGYAARSCDRCIFVSLTSVLLTIATAGGERIAVCTPIASMANMAEDGRHGRCSGGVIQPTRVFFSAFFRASRKMWWCTSMTLGVWSWEVGDAEMSTVTCGRAMGVMGPWRT